MARGISLANKCLLLFGLAVVVIVAAALVVPWVRMRVVVDDAQREASRQLARAWGEELLNGNARLEDGQRVTTMLGSEVTITLYDTRGWMDAPFDATNDKRFEAAARRSLQERDAKRKTNDATRAAELEHAEALWTEHGRRYSVAREVRDDTGALRGVVVVHRASAGASGQVFTDRLLLVGAGLGASLFAIAVFYLITKRIILGPVRKLRDTADLVRAGDTAVRSQIATGDEFEQLSDTFNAMLTVLTEQQNQLRAINASLDLKLTEMAEANIALYEAAKMKGEFVASVSHELRTPLNSIIGFAEILRDIAESDIESAEQDDVDATIVTKLTKRKRYTDHIVSAGRSLLEMINELLMMAKLDAGRMELHVAPMNVAETCEGLVALIRPLAEKKRIELRVQLGSGTLPAHAGKPGADLPLVNTDAQKLQQIVFNFLSNAVKFTPERGDVSLRAERLVAGDGKVRVRISVLDSGPGIPEDQHATVFERFRQLEGGHTRQAGGTGLGLAIAKQFAEMIQAELQLVSEVGRGSMFSVIVPLELDPNKPPPTLDALLPTIDRST
ncbi:MAG: HAMP domain-containing histidine kinase [Phycisphaerales bacterium]|nr:HAMP domain-containing histidine kinase [Phycisphaerales bacterium]